VFFAIEQAPILCPRLMQCKKTAIIPPFICCSAVMLTNPQVNCEQLLLSKSYTNSLSTSGRIFKLVVILQHKDLKKSIISLALG